MKNLAAEIKTGHKDRAARIGEIKSAAKDILSDADAYMKQVAADLKEAAKNLRDFLAESEATRKKDFDAMIKGIQAKIKEIKGDVNDFLAKSEGKRMADFKGMMKDITGAVSAIQRTTGALLSDYNSGRKAAAGYWAGLSKKGAAPAAEEEVSPKPKRKRAK